MPDHDWRPPLLAAASAFAGATVDAIETTRKDGDMGTSDGVGAGETLTQAIDGVILLLDAMHAALGGLPPHDDALRAELAAWIRAEGENGR